MNRLFAKCIKNDRCEDLKIEKMYKIVKCVEDEYCVVIDKSGEDYLYPKSYFKFFIGNENLSYLELSKTYQGKF